MCHGNESNRRNIPYGMNLVGVCLFSVADATMQSVCIGPVALCAVAFCFVFFFSLSLLPGLVPSCTLCLCTAGF